MIVFRYVPIGPSMNLVIVHHHLNRGGVTQVILNHLRALHAADARDKFERVVVLHGGRADGWPAGDEPALENIHVEAVSGIDYDTVTPVTPDEPYDAMHAALARLELSAESTLLHVHNHTLGKNIAWPKTLERLAEDGYRQLLQLHDFAEDFRPDNYRRQAAFYETGPNGSPLAEVYFQAPHVHYAVLNSRDRKILNQAGLADSHLHWLPNPVQPFPPLPDRAAARAKLKSLFGVPEDRPYILYPVRGIRRKNVGELLLWSAIAPRPATFAITLAPVNPDELAPYRRWQQLAEELELPCLFDVGGAGKLTFLENLAAADAIINTSVAEGFGLVFLEAWLAGKMLMGRDLPEISADFKDRGLRLDSLAAALLVPVRLSDDAREVFSKTRYRERMETLFADVLLAFCRPAPDHASIEARIEGLFDGEWIDFAMLTVDAQREVIRRVAKDKPLAAAIAERNTAAMQPLVEEPTVQASTIQLNAQVVITRFGLAGTGQRLADIYDQLQQQPAGPVQPFAGAGEILRQFVDLGRLNPVRLESP